MDGHEEMSKLGDRRHQAPADAAAAAATRRNRRLLLIVDNDALCEINSLYL